MPLLRAAGAGARPNTATVSSTSTHDPVTGNDSDSADVDALDADLAITKTVDDPTPNLGADVTFTVTVDNNGPDGATGVQVDDLLPAGLTYVSDTSGGGYDDVTGVWSIGSLANGASTSMDITATVTTSVLVTNTATVSSTTADPTSGNDSDSAAVDAVAADLAVSKTVDDSTPNVGDDVTFTVTVDNNGPDAAAGVQVDDLLPAGLTYVGDTGGGAYTSATGVWAVGSLANGSTASLQITVRVTTLNAVPANVGARAAIVAKPRSGWATTA